MKAEHPTIPIHSHHNFIDMLTEANPKLKDYINIYEWNTRQKSLIYEISKPATNLYVVLDGRVFVERDTYDGNNYVNYVAQSFSPLSMFGFESISQENGVYTASARPAQLNTQDPCTIASIDARAAKESLQIDPIFFSTCMNQANEASKFVERQRNGIAYKLVKARVAETLLLLCPTGSDVLHVKHSDIASCIAAYRETTSSTLEDLQFLGLIQLGNKEINILDRNKLIHLAAENGRRSDMKDI